MLSYMDHIGVTYGLYGVQGKITPIMENHMGKKAKLHGNWVDVGVYRDDYPSPCLEHLKSKISTILRTPQEPFGNCSGPGV